MFSISIFLTIILCLASLFFPTFSFDGNEIPIAITTDSIYYILPVLVVMLFVSLKRESSFFTLVVCETIAIIPLLVMISNFFQLAEYDVKFNFLGIIILIGYIINIILFFKSIIYKYRFSLDYLGLGSLGCHVIPTIQSIICALSLLFIASVDLILNIFIIITMLSCLLVQHYISSEKDSLNLISLILSIFLLPVIYLFYLMNVDNIIINNLQKIVMILFIICSAITSALFFIGYKIEESYY